MKTVKKGGVRVYTNYAPALRSGREGLKVVEEYPISTNGTDIAGCIRATYYKNGERNVLKNLIDGGGYEGVIEPISCAVRGRYTKSNGKIEQHLEIGGTIAHSITTVGKDMMILEMREENETCENQTSN